MDERSLQGQRRQKEVTSMKELNSELRNGIERMDCIPLTSLWFPPRHTQLKTKVSENRVGMGNEWNDFSV